MAYPEDIYTKEMLCTSDRNNARTRVKLNVPKGYVLHHIDENMKYENPMRYIQWREEDVVPMSKGEHTRLHWTGRQHTEETRRKMSEAKKGYVPTEETKKKLSEALTGRNLSEEHKRKLSESHKGKSYGPLSEEHKKAIGEAHKGMKHTEETIEVIRQASKGNTNTKGRKWFNDGTKSVMAYECPEGFVPGRKKYGES